MSIISQDNTNEVAVLDCIQRFFSSHKVGTLLKKCNDTKEKGVPAISLLKYKLSNVFVGRSMYMQQRTESFKEDFCKNTFYRFLNSTKTNCSALLLPQHRRSSMMKLKILRMKSVLMFSLSMILSSIVPAVRRPNLVPEFWITLE